MEEIVNVISTLGFPVAITCALFYFFAKFIQKQMETSAKREETLMENSRIREERLTAQLDKFAESLNNFNITLTKIDSRLAWLEQHITKNDGSTEL